MRMRNDSQRRCSDRPEQRRCLEWSKSWEGVHIRTVMGECTQTSTPAGWRGRRVPRQRGRTVIRISGRSRTWWVSAGLVSGYSACPQEQAWGVTLMTSMVPPVPGNAQGALLHARVEGGDPHFLLLDDGEQLRDLWAYDEQGLFPTGGIARKPCWQGNRGIHRPPQVTHLEALKAPHECSCQTVPEAHVAALSRELLQQGPRLLEVGGVKALGEPAVNRREQFAGFIPLALLLPQPTQAHGRAQLQRLHLLATSGIEGLVKTGFGLLHLR